MPYKKRSNSSNQYLFTILMLLLILLLSACSSTPPPREIQYVDRIEYKIPEGYVKKPDEKLYRYVPKTLQLISDGRKVSVKLWIKEAVVQYNQCAINNNALVNSLEVQK